MQGKPEQAGGEAYVGGPLLSTIGGQETEGSNQHVQELTLFVAHLTSLGKWHAFSIGGGSVKAYEAGW